MALPGRCAVSVISLDVTVAALCMSRIAGLLTPFVTSGGVSGNFVLSCGDDGKGAQLKRL